MRRLLLACALVAGCGDDIAQQPPNPTGPITATVTDYAYRFDVDTRAAHATLTMTVDQAGDCVTLPFRGQDLQGVKIDGADAMVTSDAASLTACGTGHTIGSTLTLEADLTVALATEGTSQIGYSITMDTDGNPFYYLVSWVGGCDRFAPCDTAPYRFAHYHFDVTHAASLTVRCPGDITEVGPTETTCSFEHDGGPTYSTFGLAAYPAWTQADEGMWGSAHVVLYDRGSTGIAALIDKTYHAGYVAWLESQLGPFPYGPELRLLTAPTYWNGFEHPGNIVLADTLAHQTMQYANNVAHVIDHEITHQWAGDQTTLADTYDFAWKESMAEYLSFVWEDMHDPAVAQVTSGLWKRLGPQSKHFPVPTDDPDLFAYYTDVYGPGPMIFFRQLEVLSSRDQVLAAIKGVLGTPGALSVDTLVAALERSTGLDLTQYAATWIKGAGLPAWPRYAMTFTPATGTSTLSIHQVNTLAAGCKFHVELDGASAGQTALVEVDTFHTPGDQVLQVPTPAFTVTGLQIDPLHECLVYLDSAMTREAPLLPWVSDHGVF